MTHRRFVVQAKDGRLLTDPALAKLGHKVAMVFSSEDEAYQEIFSRLVVINPDELVRGLGHVPLRDIHVKEVR